MIAIFPKDAPFPVYCPKCWWSDKWDPGAYAREYDPSKHFFIQFRELMEKVPKQGLYIAYTQSVNSPYINLTGPVKNCYLVFLGEECENCLYSYSLRRVRDSLDCTHVDSSTNGYDLFYCSNCYNVQHSFECHDCIDVYFSRNLRNCSNCFGCANLTGKKFHLFNKPYSPEAYREEVKKFDLGSHRTVTEFAARTRIEHLRFPTKYMCGYSNTDVTGNYIYHSKNTKNSFEVEGAADSRFCFQTLVPGTTNSYDYGDWGNNVSYMYESVNCGENMNRVKFSFGTWIGTNQDYCDCIVSCDNMFGCICMSKKKYCVLNKQYSKEEYERLRERIVNDMNERPYVDARGRVYRYGEFLPVELSPYPYNDTAAQEYFPLSRDEARAKGYGWREPEERNHTVTREPGDLPDNIDDAGDDILEATIGCSHRGICAHRCATAFKIVPEELHLYRSMRIPLPRLCHNCRHYGRTKERNPLTLWRRRCMCQASGVKYQGGKRYENTAWHFHGTEPCPVEFETTYSPERPEIVYCEQCYQAEVA